MIKCFWSRIPTCPRAAVKQVTVRRQGHVDQTWETCAEHHPVEMFEAMDRAKEVGGSTSTTKIDIPVRKIKVETVNINSPIPRAEHTEMVIVAQSLRMSHRQFIRMAINNQISVEKLKAQRKEDNDHA
jgi:hypothetical protein